jgi:valyl-tRNA synthetase
MSPIEMIDLHSADAVRYWAASSGPGKDAIISEEKIRLGAKLAIKLWNVGRFSQRFLSGYVPPAEPREGVPNLSPADRWILARTQRLIRRVTDLFYKYDYAAAKNETEVFFWRDLADNYLEMAKVRLYGDQMAEKAGAHYTLYHVLLTTIKLFAPVIPHVTDEIYRQLFAKTDGAASIHRSRWPQSDARFEDEASDAFGETLVQIATAVRRFKSESNLSLGTEIARLQLATGDAPLAEMLRAASSDITSVTRAGSVEVVPTLGSGLEVIPSDGAVQIALSAD